MPISRNRVLPCPTCGTTTRFSQVTGVDADRRPDHRHAVIDGSLLRKTCVHCGTSFRMQPDFCYVDRSRGQWIAAFPYEKLAVWTDCESRAQGLFRATQGAEAPRDARDVAAGLTARITFGWPALREKLMIAAHGLDDVTVELCKLSLVRGEAVSRPAGAELRFNDVRDGDFLMQWTLAVSEHVVEVVPIERASYDEIDRDAGVWRQLRADVGAGMFVDMQRPRIQAD